MDFSINKKSAKIKEVNVFSDGDSSEMSTWSNIPYFFTKTLVEKGIKVNRIDISPNIIFQRLFNLFVWRILNKYKKGHFYTYLRTKIHFYDVNRKIKRAVKKYNKADVNIFISFSHSSKQFDKRPVILFCDWTINYYFSYFLQRQPDILERQSLLRQDREIKNSDLVVSLFPGVAKYMENYYKGSKVLYLGNVVNSELSVSEEDLIHIKSISKDILFIGSKRYFEGANILIECFSFLQKEIPGLRLHIVGMKEGDFSHIPPNVTCYGYLDKGVDQQRAIYYELLSNARVVVNTTPKWGAFSSTIEAMYFYCPVITTAYNEFVETFGSEITFGYYGDAEDKQQLCLLLKNIFLDKSYEKMCREAHKAVEGFTWSAYIDKLLIRADELI